MARIAVVVALAAVAAVVLPWAASPPEMTAGVLAAKHAVRQRAEGTLVPSGDSVVAQAGVRRVRVYTLPDGRVREVLRNPTPYGPLVFLVKWHGTRWRPTRWVHVYLPQRPNGSTGWIRASDTTLLRDAYRVTIDLASHRLVVERNARPVMEARIGVGTAVTPTPTGTYYLVELLKQPYASGPYGPYAFGTSAFSPTLTSFGGGPGQIGIHGTNDPAGIGSDVSHGCIRLTNADIVRLAHTLPLGTPVRIIR